MFFKEIGLLLKNKREEIGITHENVANKLKIPVRSIIAIENGSLEDLPHEVYVRTFLKGYAHFLGFSSDEIQTVFTNIDDFATHVETPKSLEVKRAEAQPDESKPKNVRFIVQLLLVALLGAGAYFYYTHNGRSATFNFTSLFSLFKSDRPSEIIVVPDSSDEDVWTPNDTDIKPIEKNKNTEDVILDSTSATKVNETIEDDDVKQVSSSKTPSEEALLESGVARNSESDKKNITLVNAADSNIKQVEAFALDIDSFAEEDFETFIANTPEAFVIDWNTLSDVKSGQQQAVIYVTQDCWMHVTVDGKAEHFTVRKGNQKELLFKDTLQLKLGNASAVTLFHNRKLVTVGDSSALRTINLKAK